jgi:hypothetical protein
MQTVFIPAQSRSLERSPFTAGGNEAGHVAVSTENGQEIATLGYVGDRYPVSHTSLSGRPN